jgi:hypothetical protein
MERRVAHLGSVDPDAEVSPLSRRLDHEAAVVRGGGRVGVIEDGHADARPSDRRVRLSLHDSTFDPRLHRDGVKDRQGQARDE